MIQRLIAIPGGTGTIGHSIVAALLDHPEYKPIILSRATPTKPDGTSNTTIASSGIPVETHHVNYASIPSLTTALQGVDTVISTLLIPGPEWVTYQLNLLSASIEVGAHRFAPSEWALSQKAHTEIDIDAGKIVVWDAVKKAVADGKIDAAAFPVGMFMNYLAIGIPDRDREIEARAGFREGPLMFHLDEEPAWIEVPVTGEGQHPVLTMTDVRDVGRFVVAALGIEEPWGGRELGISGDTRNLREIVDDIQRVLDGRVSVREVAKRDLERRLEAMDEGDFYGRMDVQYTILCGKGLSVVDGVLNELCPEVKPTSIREFMERYWGA
ncbi:hypothetical protein BJX76DRAFT_364845 [Aspergillus varians]